MLILKWVFTFAVVFGVFAFAVCAVIANITVHNQRETKMSQDLVDRIRKNR